MRALFAIVLLGCAHEEHALRFSGPTMELQLDDGKSSEKPLTPDKPFEQLIRFEPRLGHFIPLRMRFLLAQPGHLVFVFYPTAGKGAPGPEIGRIDRSYDAQLVSDGKDGRWVIEELTLPAQRAPLWIGISAPGGGGGLWASSNASGNVFNRDPDPKALLTANKSPRTPVLRLEVAPAPPPGTPAK